MEVRKNKPLLQVIGAVTACGILSFTAILLLRDGTEEHSREKRECSASELEHGRTQLEQLLRDRPEMCLLDPRSTEIGEWVIREFAGEDLWTVVSWNPEPPKRAGVNGVHRYPTRQNTGWVRIRSRGQDPTSKEHRFESTWKSLVFELNNISHAGEFEQVHRDAIDLDFPMTKDDYIRRMTSIEYQSLKNTRDFYERSWKPILEKKGFKTDPAIWGTDLPSTHDAWIGRSQNESKYPWASYGKYYDEVISPFRARNGKS
jgi:hypothetical protein